MLLHADASARGSLRNAMKAGPSSRAQLMLLGAVMMRNQHVVLSLMLTLGGSACGTPPEPAESQLEAQAIGVCGANADPTTGVRCSYRFNPLQRFPDLTGVEIFERNSVDYVRCRWSVTCKSDDGLATSDSGARCLSTIGTGCAQTTEAASMVFEIALPAGTPATGARLACEVNTAPSQQAINTACGALDRTVEQYEDLCCLPRVTPPPTPTPDPEPAPSPEAI
jgi:hypothetical protein